MGCTLRAALDAIPPGGRIIVAELNPCVVEWCRGPLAPLSRAALDDPRVTVAVADVGSVLAEAAPGSLEGVLLDLYEGPRVGGDAIFGGPGVERIGAALAPGGVLAVWSEAPVPAFERRLVRAGFEVERTRAGRGGRRHAITVARRPAARRGTQREAGSRGGPRRGRAARVPTSGA